MARVTTCRFCRQSSVDGDHPKCALAFGKPIEARLLKHHREFPHHPIPRELLDEIFFPQWGWYNEYVKKQEKEDHFIDHVTTVRNNVREEAERILSEPANAKRLQDLLIPYNGITFHVVIQSAVNVVEEKKIAKKK